jgi:CheY-like chemotaxis protein
MQNAFFCLWSHLEAEESRKPMQENKPASPHARGKAIILIVDDSPTIRKLVSMTLESRGYTVVVACDGVDGLAKMQESVPDLILSDITMPRLDGYQFCKVIKSNKATKHIPVIMLSGNDGLFDKVRGRMAGSANYITKPFEPNNLVKEIEKFVKANRPAQAAPASARQPATAQGPSPAQAKGGSPLDKPADPIAARQLSQKLSGIYIPPGASTGGFAKVAAQAPPGASPVAKAAPPASPRPELQAPAAKRPSPKHNDEPEIKIFYHNDPPAAQAAASISEAAQHQQPSHEHRGAEQHAAAAQMRQAPAQQKSPPGQPAANRPQQPAAPASAQPPRSAAPGQANLLKATCSGCGTVYANIKPEHVGKYARCKKCGTRFLITV